jgi:hypothetical protein
MEPTKVIHGISCVVGLVVFGLQWLVKQTGVTCSRLRNGAWLKEKV